MNNELAVIGSDTTRIDRETKGFASGIPQFLSQSWQGTLFGTERNSMKPSEAAGLQDAVEAAVRKELSDVHHEQMRLVLDHAKAVMLCFLQSKDVVTTIDQNGLADLTRAAIASCKDTAYLEDMEIRVGFGSAPLEAPNARVPAYVLAAKKILESLAKGRERAELLTRLDMVSPKFPANKYGKLRTNLLFDRPLSEEQAQLLSAMQEMLKTNVPSNESEEAAKLTLFPKALPKVVLYSAHNFVGNTNGDAEAVRSCALANMKYLQAYIQEACDPKIAERFRFDEDREVEEASVLGRMIEYYAYTFRIATDERTIQARDKVLGFGKKHAEGNEEGSLRYGVSHALYSGDAVRLPGVPMLRDAPAKPRKLIMIGGEPEKVFWKVRQAVCREATLEGGIGYFRSRMEEIGVLQEGSGYPESLRLVEGQAPEAQEDLLRVQLISKVGEIPVYSGEVAGAEPSLTEITSMTLAEIVQKNMGRTSVKEDLLHLIADLGGVSPDVVRDIAKGKPAPPSVAEGMERGLQRLKKIVISI